MAEVDQALDSLFEEGESATERHVRVVLTLRPGTNKDVLESAGMEVDMKTREGTIASGSVDKTALDRLRDHPSVLRIEPDGEMTILD